MKDLQGGNMGPIFALGFDKIDSNMDKGSDAFECCVLSRFNAKSAAAADKVVEVLKTKRAAVVAASPEFKRSCIIPVKLGEQPGASEVETVYLEWWKSKTSFKNAPAGGLSIDEGLLADGSDETGASIMFEEALAFAR